jgi:hypothetical protein
LFSEGRRPPLLYCADQQRRISETWQKTGNVVLTLEEGRS